MTYAQAPVKHELQLPTKAWQREAQPGLEDLGFKFLGEDATMHAIFQHPTAGQVRMAGTPSGDRAESIRQAFGRARRLLAIQESEAGEFLTHLRDLYGILPHESKQVRLNLPEEINNWARRAKPRMNTTQLRSVLRDSPFLEIRDPVKGARRQDYIIHGSDALTPEGDLKPGIVVDAELVEERRQAFLRRVADTGGAVAWLATLLQNGATKTGDVEDAANQAGFAWNAVKNAATELGIIYDKEAAYQGTTYWRLPAPPEIAGLKPSNGSAPTGDTATATADPPPAAPEPPHPATPAAKPEAPPAAAASPPARPPSAEPEQQVAAAAARVPTPAAPGDLLTQISSLVERASRADTAEAKVAIAADELRAVVALCTTLAESAAALRQRCESALDVIDAA